MASLAERILEDYDARTPGRLACQPPELTIAQAYELQAAVVHFREQRGEKVIGYKVGCTSKAIQEQLGVTEPIFGRLFDTECHPSGVHLNHARYANLAVEGELAVRLSKDLPNTMLSAEECRHAIAAVFPVIELHHYIFPEAWPLGNWLIASNGIHAGVVLAEVETRGAGLANHVQNLSIRINEVVVGAAEDTTSLVCPIESLRWLAKRLAKSGLQLNKGQIVLTGSPLKLYPVAPGSRIVVEAPGLGVASVEIDS